jgi:hypothetical protein
MSDHYETLGVRRNASSEEIKTSYRRLVRNYHPDKLPPGTPELVKRDAAEKFLVIKNAFDVLSTSDRLAYDRSIGVEAKPPWPTSSPPTTPPPPPTAQADVYCRECGSQLSGKTCPRCTERQSSVLYRFGRGLSNYGDYLSTHPSMVFLWVVFFTVGLGVAIIIPQQGFYTDGVPWDAEACRGILGFLILGFVITLLKTGFGGVQRGIAKLSSKRPFVATLALQFAFLAVLALVVGASQVPPKPKIPQQTFTEFLNSKLSGQFTGAVTNTTSNLEASAELALQQTNGAVAGCFVVFRPLYGSGQVTGSVHGLTFAFVAQSPNFDITFTGHQDGDGLKGTYVVTRGGTGLQNGTFQLSRSHTALADGLKTSDCPSD